MKPDYLSKNSFRCTLLFIVAIGTYYNSAIYGDFIHLDDMGLILRLINTTSFDISDIFFGKLTDRYYRPFVELSYQVDRILYFDVAFGYHFTNVVFHTLNVFLVYAASLVLFKGVISDYRALALLSALYFAINPLLSESVCWVTGRSDILATNFTLSSFICYLFYKRKRRHIYLLLSGIFFIGAAMTKEVAFALPLLIVFFELVYQKKFLFAKKDRTATYLILSAFIIMISLYLLLFRGINIDTKGLELRIGQEGIVSKSIADNIRIFLASFGFYVKKLFFPYPLNLAIHKINEPLYALLGIITLSLTFVWCVIRPSIYGFFATWIMVCLSPSVAAAVLHLPWTPWAERFLYLPMVGFSMAFGLASIKFKRRYKNKAIILIALIYFLLWSGTQHRIYTRVDELRLWEDTASKTDYGPVYYQYGSALLRDGQKTKAIEQFERGIKKGYSYSSYLSLARIKLSMKDYDGYQATMNKLIEQFPAKGWLHKKFAEDFLKIAQKNEKDGPYYVKKAIYEYEKYANWNTNNIRAQFIVATLHKNNGNIEDAIPFLKRIIAIDPESRYAVTARRNLKEATESE